jgi:hypothetical protein
MERSLSLTNRGKASSFEANNRWLCSVRRAVSKEMAIAALGHPFGPREMARPLPPSSIRILIHVELQDNRLRGLVRVGNAASAGTWRGTVGRRAPTSPG